MKVYKFRDFKNKKYLNDILIKEQLYCSEYKKLNDPFEGQFFKIIEEANKFPMKFPIQFGKIEQKKIYEINKDLRICSLSASYNDVRMWAYYADSQKGLCIEIELD